MKIVINETKKYLAPDQYEYNTGYKTGYSAASCNRDKESDFTNKTEPYKSGYKHGYNACKNLS